MNTLRTGNGNIIRNLVDVYYLLQKYVCNRNQVDGG